MSRFFAADSVLMLFLSRLFDIIILSGIFLLCCVPVITIGPALCALYDTTDKVIVKRKGYLIRTFFQSFRINFRQGIGIWLLLLGVMLLMAVNVLYSLYSFQGIFRIVMLAIYFAILFLAVILVGYCFPILSRFSCQGKQLFMNAAAIGTAYPFKTLLLLVLQLVFYFSLAFCFAAAPLLLFFLPVGYAVLERLLLEKIFAVYMGEITEQAEE